ncbi:hypothetical protein Sros_9255 [Streptosporangium roseum DSM 43021]|uniref:Uncharacterized protein n=1 Tax=Streptosporangium roseum (strain ATCC 12428 / DSM 43021 / JCM 3005 / KCTC 9067 / NCIMB 10171 / NRRL 2505 / NI 9100) TaxID=479432 RepID=D2BCQ3_STRRD|nr:hypothetical protein Sros_9255 [Streptosporangium roseum DSM 43021]
MGGGAKAHRGATGLAAVGTAADGSRVRLRHGARLQHKGSWGPQKSAAETRASGGTGRTIRAGGDEDGNASSGWSVSGTSVGCSAGVSGTRVVLGLAVGRTVSAGVAGSGGAGSCAGEVVRGAEVAVVPVVGLGAGLAFSFGGAGLDVGRGVAGREVACSLPVVGFAAGRVASSRGPGPGVPVCEDVGSAPAVLLCVGVGPGSAAGPSLLAGSGGSLLAGAAVSTGPGDFARDAFGADFFERDEVLSLGERLWACGFEVRSGA